MDEKTKQKEQVPPATFSAPPEPELEDEVRKNPHDEDAKVDLGSDESMDASDPPAAAQPGSGGEPVPSSGYQEQKDR